MRKNSNSRIFRMVLDRLCEIEAEWKPPVAKGGGPIILGLVADENNPAIWERVAYAKCLPYKRLRKLLDLEKSDNGEVEGYAGEGERAIKALNALPGLSGFSVYQVIDGCAQALKFSGDIKKRDQFRNSIRNYRNSHTLTKNPGRIRQRAGEMLRTALVVNSSISLAGKALSLIREEGKESELAEISRTRIRQHRYGCIHYQTDRLINHVPTPTALLAFNLEWIFRHWPLSKETFPTWPPRIQPRNRRAEVSCGKPRRNVVVHFLNSIFQSADSVFDATALKDNLNIPKNAEFCGW